MNNTNLPASLKISAVLAFVASAVVIPMELIRRWHQLNDPNYFFAWFDDMIACGFLLLGAWKIYRSPGGQKFLAAAWGFAAGMMYSSFFIQFANQDLPDPSGVAVEKVLVFKFCMLLITISGLVLSLLKSSKND